MSRSNIRHYYTFTFFFFQTTIWRWDIKTSSSLYYKTLLASHKMLHIISTFGLTCMCFHYCYWFLFLLLFLLLILSWGFSNSDVDKYEQYNNDNDKFMLHSKTITLKRSQNCCKTLITLSYVVFKSWWKKRNIILAN